MKIKKSFLNLYFLFRLPYIYLLRLLVKASGNKPDKISKILIIRIDRMGDFVLTLPVIDNLKLKFPRAEITIVVRPYLKELAEFVTKIDKIIIYENKNAAIKAIGKEKYDLAIDMLYDYRLDSAFLALASKAPVRAGFAWGFRELWFNYSVKPHQTRNKDMVELNLELLESLDIPVTVTVPKLTADSKETGDMIIAIHPGGYYESQRWQAEKFISLSKNILDTYEADLAIIGSAAEEELVKCIVCGIDNKKARAEITRMKDLVSLLSKCRLLICNNSGPLHLAAALGLPTVSTMGPTDPVLWKPRGENNVVIRKNLPCSPCLRAKCDNPKCMESITVEEMFAAVKNILSRSVAWAKARND